MSLVTVDTRLYCKKSGDYPIYLNQLGLRGVGSFAEAVLSEALVFFEIYPVLDTEVPVGEVVEEGLPEERDGQWYRTYTTRPFDEIEQEEQLTLRRGALLVKIEALRNSEFEKGFPHLFNNGKDLYHVQVRDRDQNNILVRRTLAKEAIAEGKLHEVTFRVYENVSVKLSAEDVVELADAMLVQVETAYQRTWDLKDAATAAKTLAELPTLPDTLFNT